METKIISRPGYDLHVISPGKFKSARLEVVFSRPLKKEEITVRNVLSSLLSKSNQVYKTHREMYNKAQDLFIGGTTLYNSVNINNTYLTFGIDYIEEKYTGFATDKDAVIFLLDMIFKPNLVNDGFDPVEFDIVKSNHEKNILAIKENPSNYAFLQMLDIMAPNAPISYRTEGNLEDLLALTPQTIYECYKDIIENDRVDVFLSTDNDYQYIIDILDAQFQKNNKVEIPFEVPYAFTEFNDVKQVKEPKETTQSKLCMAYKINNMATVKEKYALVLFNMIFGSSPKSKLFEVVREQNSLCYSIHSTIFTMGGYMYVSSGIDAKNFDKTVKLITSEFAKMQQGNILEEELSAAKSLSINGKKDILDKKGAIMAKVVRQFFNDELSLEEEIDIIASLTLQDIIDASQKLVLDTVFLLEGVREHE